MKAIRDASDYLDSQVMELLKKPVGPKEIENLKVLLGDQVMTKFKKKFKRQCR